MYPQPSSSNPLRESRSRSLAIRLALPTNPFSHRSPNLKSSQLFEEGRQRMTICHQRGKESLRWARCCLSTTRRSLQVLTITSDAAIVSHNTNSSRPSLKNSHMCQRQTFTKNCKTTRRRSSRWKQSCTTRESSRSSSLPCFRSTARSWGIQSLAIDTLQIPHSAPASWTAPTVAKTNAKSNSPDSQRLTSSFSTKCAAIA